MLGIVKITVKLELPAAGGLYRFSNMTYRGVQVGKVTAMDVPRNAATATLALNLDPWNDLRGDRRVNSENAF